MSFGQKIRKILSSNSPRKRLPNDRRSRIQHNHFPSIHMEQHAVAVEFLLLNTITPRKLSVRPKGSFRFTFVHSPILHHLGKVIHDSVAILPQQFSGKCIVLVKRRMLQNLLEKTQAIFINLSSGTKTICQNSQLQ